MSVVDARDKREAVVKIGALFFERDGAVMFQYTSDPSSIIGPRKATDRDKEAHAGAWETFLETLPRDDLSQLDHDGDGRPGGSKPRRGRKPKALKNEPAHDHSKDV